MKWHYGVYDKTGEMIPLSQSEFDQQLSNDPTYACEGERYFIERIRSVSDSHAMMSEHEDFYPSAGELASLCALAYTIRGSLQCEDKTPSSSGMLVNMLRIMLSFFSKRTQSSNDINVYNTKLTSSLRKLMLINTSEAITGDARFLPVWQCVLRIFDENSGFGCSIYIHHQKPHLVIACKGTESDSDFFDDLVSILGLKTGRGVQLSAAVDWVKNKFVYYLRKHKLDGRFSMTTAGHSRGGWLSTVIASELLRKETNFHMFAFAMDGPGAYRMIKNLGSVSRLPYALNYFSMLNEVNACGPHIPSARMLFPVCDQVNERTDSIVRNMKTHFLPVMLEQFNDDGKPKQEAIVVKWPYWQLALGIFDNAQSEFYQSFKILLAALLMYLGGERFGGVRTRYLNALNHGAGSGNLLTEVLPQEQRNDLEVDSSYETIRVNESRYSLRMLPEVQVSFLRAIIDAKTEGYPVSDYLKKIGMDYLADLLDNGKLKIEDDVEIFGLSDPQLTILASQDTNETAYHVLSYIRHCFRNKSKLLLHAPNFISEYNASIRKHIKELEQKTQQLSIKVNGISERLVVIEFQAREAKAIWHDIELELVEIERNLRDRNAQLRLIEKNNLEEFTKLSEEIKLLNETYQNRTQSRTIIRNMIIAGRVDDNIVRVKNSDASLYEYVLKREDIRSAIIEKQSSLEQSGNMPQDDQLACLLKRIPPGVEIENLSVTPQQRKYSVELDSMKGRLSSQPNTPLGSPVAYFTSRPLTSVTGTMKPTI